jgi:hypothetical protein
MDNERDFSLASASIFSGTLRHTTSFGPTAREPRPVKPTLLEPRPPRSRSRLVAAAASAEELAITPPPRIRPRLAPPVVPAEAASIEELATTPPPLSVAVAGTHDAVLVALLDAPLADGETARFGYMRKEAELIAAFARLDVSEARALHRRLTVPQAGDVLVAKLGRLTADRRLRLINFLADARRREAVAATRR